LGYGIVLEFNVNGTHGKKRLLDFKFVYSALIGNKLTKYVCKRIDRNCSIFLLDAISYAKKPDEKLRLALKRQKNKYFKQQNRKRTINECEENQAENNIADHESSSNETDEQQEP